MAADTSFPDSVGCGRHVCWGSCLSARSRLRSLLLSALSLGGLLEPPARSHLDMERGLPDAGVLELTVNVFEQPLIRHLHDSVRAVWHLEAKCGPSGRATACFPRHLWKMGGTFALTGSVTPLVPCLHASETDSLNSLRLSAVDLVLGPRAHHLTLPTSHAELKLVLANPFAPRHELLELHLLERPWKNWSRRQLRTKLWSPSLPELEKLWSPSLSGLELVGQKRDPQTTHTGPGEGKED